MYIGFRQDAGNMVTIEPFILIKYNHEIIQTCNAIYYFDCSQLPLIHTIPRVLQSEHSYLIVHTKTNL